MRPMATTRRTFVQQITALAGGSLLGRGVLRGAESGKNGPLRQAMDRVGHPAFNGSGHRAFGGAATARHDLSGLLTPRRQ